VRTVRPELPTDELSQLLSRLEPELQGLFLRFRIPLQDSEDLLQEALLALLVHRETVSSPAPWLLATLRNRCRMYWRARRRSLLEAVDGTLLEGMAGGGETRADRADLAHDLTCAISGLPRHCRSILRLRYGLDRDGAEIADRLGYSPNSIRQVTHRCLSALTRRLVDSGYAPADCAPLEVKCQPAT
jgi:RNA polymerase sigma factor (sigma-70 family)